MSIGLIVRISVTRKQKGIIEITRCMKIHVYKKIFKGSHFVFATPKHYRKPVFLHHRKDAAARVSPIGQPIRPKPSVRVIIIRSRTIKRCRNGDSAQASHDRGRVVSKGCGYIGVRAGAHPDPARINRQQDIVLVIHNLQGWLFGKAFSSRKYFDFICIKSYDSTSPIPSTGNVQVKGSVDVAKVSFFVRWKLEHKGRLH